MATKSGLTKKDREFLLKIVKDLKGLHLRMDGYDKNFKEFMKIYDEDHSSLDAMNPDSLAELLGLQTLTKTSKTNDLGEAADCVEIVFKDNGMSQDEQNLQKRIMINSMYEAVKEMCRLAGIKSVSIKIENVI